jgi:hypothetical protein
LWRKIMQGSFWQALSFGTSKNAAWPVISWRTRSRLSGTKDQAPFSGSVGWFF